MSARSEIWNLSEWRNNVGYATSVYGNGITYVTFKAVAATSGNERKLSLYNYPSSTTKSIVEWVALYKGNKPQDWTAPPEEQVTTDEFTKKTTEITKSVDGMKETITKVENNQNGFDKRVATVEKMQLLLNKMSLPYKIHRQNKEDNYKRRKLDGKTLRKHCKVKLS